MHDTSLLKMKVDRLSHKAIVSADAIVTQHNLLSSATDAERAATLSRLLDWLNGPRLLAADALAKLESALQPRDSTGALDRREAALLESSPD